jgi:deazaflavin-dependent oxidoreductase (nitroreductase family)
VTQATIQHPLARVPGFIRLPGPVIRTLLRLGVPVGPNRLITVRGRISGKPRQMALAVVRSGNHSWVVGTFGDTNWCRNMRANPDVELRLGRRRERVIARELTPTEAAEFFAQTLPASVREMNRFGKLASKFLLWYAAPDIGTDPAAAALRRPVFELVSPDPDPSSTADRTAS